MVVTKEYFKKLVDKWYDLRGNHYESALDLLEMFEEIATNTKKDCANTEVEIPRWVQQGKFDNPSILAAFNEGVKAHQRACIENDIQ